MLDMAADRFSLVARNVRRFEGQAYGVRVQDSAVSADRAAAYEPRCQEIALAPLDVVVGVMVGVLPPLLISW
jgi:hypothetical protein